MMGCEIYRRGGPLVVNVCEVFELRIKIQIVWCSWDNNPARTKIKGSPQLKTLFLQIHQDLGQGTNSVE